MPASWLPAPLIPPFRFGTVEPEVYRGAYPKQRNLRYLKRLKLKTILSLVPDEPDEVFQEFCRQQGIHPIHLSVDKVKDNVPLTYNRAVEAVQIIIDPDNLPIYVHCLDGAVVTGLVICCLRKLQTWNISSAMGEFLRFLRGGVISSEESVFVEKFGSEIEISKPIPLWLWEGQVTFKKHPTLKLKFTIPPTAASSASGTIGSNTSAVTGSGANASHQNMNASPNLPGSHHSGSTVNVSSQGGHSLGASGYSGQMANSSSGNSISSQTSTGSVTNTATGGRSNTTAAISSTGAPTPGSGLMNHASRSSAMGASRDRPGTNKSNIRTDLQGQTSPSPLSTSTSASMATQAQARSNQVTTDNQESISDSGNGATTTTRADYGLTENPGLGVSLNSNVEGPGGSIVSEYDASGQAKSVPSSLIHDQDSREQNSFVTTGIAGRDSESTTKDTSANTTNSVSNSNQIRSSGAKNSPAPTPTATAAPEVVDEYYEVSMTLKALALEGADF
ncbi:hypothetical protein FBU30_006074 [Linnemannia zychae]|nr:hypothetical protein FBU30_006074 [Linnemannia zychae]